MEMQHATVMLTETIEQLAVKPGGIYVDATLGGGGHSEAICQQLDKSGRLIGIDQDDYALGRAVDRLKPYPCQKRFVKNNFVNLSQVLDELGVSAIDGIVYDLGTSSFHFDDPERGFSYQHEGPLDMRMDQTKELTASVVVNQYDEAALLKILYEYGEERHAKRIVSALMAARAKKPLATTTELAELIKDAYPAAERRKAKHPARKTFQAVRLEVNGELRILEKALDSGIAALKPGGRMAVITFHSLEDRMTKNLFKIHADPCICPPDFPVCACGRVADIRRITRKPMLPSAEEITNNNRARSAKLRVIEKL